MSKKSDEIELIPDAWERFERAFDVVAKTGPQPMRVKPHEEIKLGKSKGRTAEKKKSSTSDEAGE
jgi:hypothetical protein